MLDCVVLIICIFGGWIISLIMLAIAKGRAQGKLIFFATGLWSVVLNIITLLALPSQARYEENMMQDRFGSVYEQYIKRAGRFFPRLRRNNTIP